MSRLLTTGYETGDLAESGNSVIGTNATLTVVNTAPTPRAGSYCLKVGATQVNPNATYKSYAMSTALTDVWVRFAFFCHLSPSLAVETTIAQWSDSAAAAQVSLTYHPSDGLLRAYRGSAGTLLATAGTALPLDTWHVVEWRVQILTATTGTVEVWLDGNRVINFSGDTSNTATLNVQTLFLGQINNIVNMSAVGRYLGFDDVAINDTAGTLNNGRPGDGRVILLGPNGAGSTTQLTRGGTDTGANYSQVNEIPPSMTQYVSSTTVGNRDLYALANLPIPVASINVVEVLALAQNADASGGSVGLTVKSGATTNEATAIGLSTAAGYVRGRWETDPATSTAWTSAAVDALEAGATVR